MTWYFCYYVNAKYGQTYLNPLECIHTAILEESCSDVIIHTGNSHAIHEIGTNLKMYGLGTAIIIETTNEEDVAVLKLMDNAIIDEAKFRNEQKPLLQLILCSPNFNKMNSICQDLEIAKHHQQCSREDMEEVVRVIQRQADKLERMVDNPDSRLSETFKKLTHDYLKSCSLEIESQTANHRITASKTTGLRKQLMHAFTPFIAYMNKNGGFK